jgi:hypothetical protein
MEILSVPLCIVHHQRDDQFCVTALVKQTKHTTSNKIVTYKTTNLLFLTNGNLK